MVLNLKGDTRKSDATIKGHMPFFGNIDAPATKPERSEMGNTGAERSVLGLSLFESGKGR